MENKGVEKCVETVENRNGKSEDFPFQQVLFKGWTPLSNQRFEHKTCLLPGNLILSSTNFTQRLNVFAELPLRATRREGFKFQRSCSQVKKTCEHCRAKVFCYFVGDGASTPRSKVNSNFVERMGEGSLPLAGVPMEQRNSFPYRARRSCSD